MSRLTFKLETEDGSGNIQNKTDLNLSAITVFKDGVQVSGLVWQNNGDGHYLTSVTENGKYTIKINGIEQDEYKDIYIATEATLHTGSLDSTTLFIDGNGKLSLVSQSQYLYSGLVVDNLNSTNPAEILSANQGRIIRQTYVSQSAIIDNLGGSNPKRVISENALTTYSASVSTQIQGIKDDIDLNFASEIILDSTKTISQNFERVQTAIRGVTNGVVAGRVDTVYIGPALLSSESIADTVLSSDYGPGYKRWVEDNSTAYIPKWKISKQKMYWDRTAILEFKTIHTGSDGSGSFNFRVSDDTTAVNRETQGIFIDALSSNTRYTLTADISELTNGTELDFALQFKAASGYHVSAHNYAMKVYTVSDDEVSVRNFLGLEGSSSIVTATNQDAS